MFLTGGHAINESWAIALSAEFVEEGEGSTNVHFVQAGGEPAWQSLPWLGNAAVVSCDIAEGPGGTQAYALLSEHGVVMIGNRHGQQVERIEGAGLTDLSDRGYMSDLREIGGELYACGMSGQLYRRQWPDGWRDVVPEITAEERAREEQYARTIMSLGTGNAADGLVARGAVSSVQQRRDFVSLSEGIDGSVLLTGDFGLLARVGTDGYRELRLPEAASMTAVHPLPDGRLLAHGWHNFRVYVYEGTFEGGMTLQHTINGIDNAAAGIVWDGALYLGSKHGMFRVEDDGSAVPIRFGGEGVTEFATAGDALWVIGHQDVFRSRDGGAFERIAQPGSAGA